MASWYAAILKSLIGPQLRSHGFKRNGSSFERSVADGVVQYVSFRSSKAGAPHYKALYCEWSVTTEQFLLFREFETGHIIDRRQLVLADYVLRMMVEPSVDSPWRDPMAGSSAWILRSGSMETFGLDISNRVEECVLPELEKIVDRRSLLEHITWPPPPGAIRWVHPALASVTLSVGTVSVDQLEVGISKFMDWARDRKILTEATERFISWLRHWPGSAD